MSKLVPLQLTISLFFADSLLSVLHLFSGTMSQNTFVKQMNQFYGTSAVVTEIGALSLENSENPVIMLTTHPPSLDSLCRRQIYFCLNRKLAQNVHKLPLPISMHKKLLYISP